MEYNNPLVFVVAPPTAYQAINGRDFPLIQGVVILFVALFVAVNLAIDILYCLADPRIRYEKK